MAVSRQYVRTACGDIESDQLGAVLMHEHLHLDFAQKDETPFDLHKLEILEREAVPALKELKTFGCKTIVEMSFPPHRSEPWVYQQIAELAGFNLVLATGFYREIEMNTYWIHYEDDQIWPFVRKSSVEELEQFCLSEVEQGIHGSGIKPGVLKAASSQKELTPTEEKAIRAVARVQKQCGLLINTHANTPGTFEAQLNLIEKEGVNSERVCLGHTQEQLVREWDAVIECMKRGAHFSLDLRTDPKIADAIKRAFDEGFGSHLVLGMDSGFKVGYNEFRANSHWRPRQGDSNNLTWWGPGEKPYTYMFTQAIPVLEENGITDEMLNIMLVENPQRILAVN